jgi:hypothetical protein
MDCGLIAPPMPLGRSVLRCKRSPVIISDGEPFSSFISSKFSPFKISLVRTFIAALLALLSRTY